MKPHDCTRLNDAQCLHADHFFAAIYTEAANCRACKNCRYCKHCAKNGGTCGVCRRR